MIVMQHYQHPCNNYTFYYNFSCFLYCDFEVVVSIAEGSIIILDCVIVGCGTLAGNIVEEVVIEPAVLISSGFGIG